MHKFLFPILFLASLAGCTTAGGRQASASQPPSAALWTTDENDDGQEAFLGISLDDRTYVSDVRLCGPRFIFAEGSPEAVLPPGVMAKVFRCVNLDGKDWTGRTPPPYLEFSLDAGFCWSDHGTMPVRAEAVRRLEAVKAILPASFAARMDGMIAKAREIIAAAATQPAATQPADRSASRFVQMTGRGQLVGGPDDSGYVEADEIEMGYREPTSQPSEDAISFRCRTRNGQVRFRLAADPSIPLGGTGLSVIGRSEKGEATVECNGIP